MEIKNRQQRNWKKVREETQLSFESRQERNNLSVIFAHTLSELFFRPLSICVTFSPESFPCYIPAFSFFEYYFFSANFVLRFFMRFSHLHSSSRRVI